MDVAAANEALASVQTPSMGLENLFGLQDKVVVITGGSSGLGTYAAVALALQGARVYIIARREEKLKAVINEFEQRKAAKDALPTAVKGRITSITGDITSKESLKEITVKFSQHEKSVDVLLLNAGVNIFPESYPLASEGQALLDGLWNVKWSDFSHVFDVNITSVYFCAAAFAPFLAKAIPRSSKAAGPVVLVVGSTASTASASFIPPAYAASKAAVERLAIILSSLLQSFQIRVNTINPGPFPSEMSGAPTSEDFVKEGNFLRPYVVNQLIPRAGTVEDFVGSVIYLSSLAGAFLNGTHIVLDGGGHEHPHPKVLR